MEDLDGRTDGRCRYSRLSWPLCTGSGCSPTSGLGSNGCVASPGYLCSNPILSQNDNLIFTLGWFCEHQEHIQCRAACSSSATGVEDCLTVTVFRRPSGPQWSISAQEPRTAAVANAEQLRARSRSLLARHNCYRLDMLRHQLVGPSITPLIGTGFTGFLWLDYTASSGAPTVAGGANPLYTAKIATMSVKVLK